MNLTALVLLLVAAVLVTAAILALADLLRHDGQRGGRVPRSHPADTFDPQAQRFGRCA